MKKQLPIIMMMLCTLWVNAQISVLPAAESFTTEFTLAEEVVEFIPNWTGNIVRESDRIYRSTEVFATAPAAMGVTPTSGFSGDIRASLDLSAYSAVQVNFVAKSLTNAAGTRPARLTMSVSIDGGDTWIGSQLINEFPAEDQPDFLPYSYALPAEVANQANVIVRFFVNRGSGSSTAARLFIDDVTFEELTTPVIAANQTDLSLAQVAGVPSNSQPLNVSGVNLTANVNIATVAPFEISEDPSGPFNTSLTFSPDGDGNLQETTIYVRLNSATGGTFDEVISITSTGADAVEVSLTGSVIEVNLTNPAPHVLANGAYFLGEWSSESAAGTFPSNMAFWTHDTTDPDLNTPFVADYACLYSLSSRSRVDGNNENGFSFVNTGNSQFVGVCDGSDPTQTSGATDLYGRLGAAVLAINTTGVNEVSVDWIGRTVAANNRVYALRLQYRIGDGIGNANVDWTDFETPVEYVRQATGEFQEFTTTLPEACSNQPLVQLRWVYYNISGSGSRAQLGLDDIRVYDKSLSNQDFNFDNKWTVYPNPANEVLYFSKEESGVVFDVTGKSLLQFNDVNQININKLNTGVYFIQNNNGQTIKFLKN